MTFTDSDQRQSGHDFLFFGFTFLIYLDVAGPKRHVQFLDAAGKATARDNLMYSSRAINTRRLIQRIEPASAVVARPLD